MCLHVLVLLLLLLLLFFVLEHGFVVGVRMALVFESVTSEVVGGLIVCVMVLCWCEQKLRGWVKCHSDR